MMGVLDRTNQNWVLNQAFYRIVGNESRGSNAPAQPRTEITTVQQIRQLKAEELGQVPPAKIRGVVTAKITDLYLQDNTGGIRVPSWAWQKVGNCEVGQYIEVAGRCAPGGYSPVLEPGQQTDVTLLGMGRMPKPLSGTWNQLMQGKDDAQWVEVNGVIRNIQGRTLKMRMPGGDVLMDLGFGFREGYARNLIDATVRIQGVCRVIANEKKQLVGIRLIVPAAEFIVLDEVPPADPFAAPSQQVGKLLQFDDRDVVSHRVKIEGVVTCAREGVFYVQDTTGGIRVESPNDAVLHQGDRVEVVGFPDSGGFSVNLTDALIRKTGKASLPEPVELEAGGSPQAAHSSRFIKMTAVFLGRSTLLKNEVFQFQTGGRVFQGTLPEDQGFPPAIEPGSLAQLTGVCRVLQDRSGKYSDSNLEFEILLSSPADLVVLKAPDWWNLRRLLWIGGIFMGVLSVAAAWIAMISRKNRLLKLAKLELQKANEELETRVAHRTADLAKANSELSREQALLRALLDSSPDKIYFKDAQSRYLKTSKAQAQDFRAQSPDELIGKTDFDYFAEEHARPAFEDEQEIIHTGHPLIGKIEKEVRKDGQEGWVLTSKMPLRNEANEIVGTFGISKDITAIKHAEARLEEVHKQLVDASRQAGQAEVASSVLHNVGNVLNSVNVATGVITERVRGSKAATGISRVAGLLAEHRQDMAGFLAEDGRADKVTGYLEELAKQMGSEQASMLQELHDLARNVEHINEIVAMQQNYARVSGITEIQSVPALVEDALRVEANALVRNQVHVVKQFDPIPDILVDKHKVLQVLVNLITNAVNALSESTVAERVMTLKIKMNEDKNVSVSVADNGMGISPENLERIFTHGFTTRQDGHSLGLHSGFLAAREMGGTLLVHSDGPGKGAIFTLELPSQPKEKKSTVAGEAHHQRE
jgi:PAS domain S-box-containing protein